VVAGEALIVRDVVNDPEWKDRRGEIVGILLAENVRSLMYIPIKVQSMVLGVFNVCSSHPEAFDEDRQRLFTSLVQRAALSIENSRLFEKTRHMAILDERNRLAQELHDSAKQKAFAALAQVGAAKKKVIHDRGDAAEHLVEAENAVSEVIHDLTFFIQESYPKGLKERGLAVSVRDYAFTWESRTSIQLSFSILGERRLPLPIEQVLYRIVQEGLSNIARHSQDAGGSPDCLSGAMCRYRSVIMGKASICRRHQVGWACN
jgi:two-component system NarL family sensor kinase